MGPEQVFDSLGKLALMLGRELPASALKFFVEVLLERLTPEQACGAIRTWATRETRWPAPAALIELVYPRVEARDEAAALSQGLLTLIAAKGYTWESTCRYDGYATAEEGVSVELGEQALDVVRRCGGWARFCKEWGGEEGDTAARAQLRGLCESALKGAMSPGVGLLPGMSRPGGDAIGEFISHQKALKAKREVIEAKTDADRVAEENLEKIRVKIEEAINRRAAQGGTGETKAGETRQAKGE